MTLTRKGAASNYFAVGEPFMRLKARLYYALPGLNQATGFAGGYDYDVRISAIPT